MPDARAHADALTAVRMLWMGDHPPKLAEVLTPAVLADQQLLADVLSIDLEHRRASGLPHSLSSYQQQYPAILSLGSARRVLLMSEFIARTGESADHVRAALLHEHPDLQPDIDAVAAITSIVADAAPPAHTPGQRLGKYRLDALLGRGSFAHTWLAWDTALHRHVALKLLDTNHLHEHEAAKRVMNEARAAAALDHDAIVRIHEAGRFEATGEYYIDEQFVGHLSAADADGSNVTATAHSLEDLLTRNPLAPRHAAGLIRTIAQGLAAAHARGITHRDIKPANILLSSNHSPRLADFGLAHSDDSAAATSPPRRVAGTPAYIAPEVAAGQPATPLADIFSLGATLRALLTGKPPRHAAPGSAHASFTATLDLARHQPLPPLASLAPAVPRTLARIADRATAHDPRHRYASADRFAADLDAFLNHRATEADPPTPISAAALWLRRHRRSAAIAAAIILLLTTSTLAFILRLSAERTRAITAEHAAQVQRDDAIAARDTLDLINRYLARTFNSARGQRASAAFTVIDAINLGSQRVGRVFADRPLVEAAVRHFFGQAAVGAGAFDSAREQLQTALAIRRTHLGNDHRDTIATLRQIGELENTTRNLDAADQAFTEILTTLGEASALCTPDGLRSLNKRANRLTDAANLAEALRLLESIDAAYDTLPYDGSADHQLALNDLTAVYAQLGQYQAAETSQRKIIDLNTRYLGVDDISTLNATQALAAVFRAAGKPADAESVYRDVLARYRDTVGDAHLGTLHVEIELASMLIPDRAAEALTLIGDVIARTTNLPRVHILRIKSSILLGAALDATGEPQAAEAAMRDALTLCLEEQGPTDQWTRQALTQLVKLLEKQGRSAEAAALTAAAATKREPVAPPPPQKK